MLDLMTPEVTGAVNLWLDHIKLPQGALKVHLKHPKEMMELFSDLQKSEAKRTPEPVASTCWLSDSGLNRRSDNLTDHVKLHKRDRIFITMFLSLLVCDVLASKAQGHEVDFEGMLQRLQEETVGKLGSRLPNLRRFETAVHRSLCSEFGSAKDVQDALLYKRHFFEEAVKRIFREKVQERGGEVFQRVRSFLNRRTSRIFPAEVDDELLLETVQVSASESL